MLAEAQNLNLDPRLLAELADGSVEAYDYLDALFDFNSDGAVKLKAGVDIDAINERYNTVQELKEGFMDDLTKAQLEVDDGWKEVVKNVEDAVAGLDQSDLARVYTEKTMDAMLEALKYNRFKVILLGGLVRGSSLSTVGALAESNLKLFYCDKLFLGVDSFSVEAGLSTPNVEEASTNQVMISRAREVIAVFDSSKINKRALAFITMPDKINTVIIDSKLPADVHNQLKAMNINVEIVNV
jgi:hypothetical protein